MDVYIDNNPNNTVDNCPYFISTKTTIFPACSCGFEYCNEFMGYCSIRDGD